MGGIGGYVDLDRESYCRDIMREQMPKDKATKANQNYKPLDPFVRNELEKAMLGRGVDYETIQLILNDFDVRVKHLYSVIYGMNNK